MGLSNWPSLGEASTGGRQALGFVRDPALVKGLEAYLFEVDSVYEQSRAPLLIREDKLYTIGYGNFHDPTADKLADGVRIRVSIPLISSVCDAASVMSNVVPSGDKLPILEAVKPQAEGKAVDGKALETLVANFGGDAAVNAMNKSIGCELGYGELTYEGVKHAGIKKLIDSCEAGVGLANGKRISLDLGFTARGLSMKMKAGKDLVLDGIYPTGSLEHLCVPVTLAPGVFTIQVCTRGPVTGPWKMAGGKELPFNVRVGLRFVLGAGELPIAALSHRSPLDILHPVMMYRANLLDEGEFKNIKQFLAPDFGSYAKQFIAGLKNANSLSKMKAGGGSGGSVDGADGNAEVGGSMKDAAPCYGATKPVCAKNSDKCTWVAGAAGGGAGGAPANEGGDDATGHCLPAGTDMNSSPCLKVETKKQCEAKDGCKFYGPRGTCGPDDAPDSSSSDSGSSSGDDSGSGSSDGGSDGSSDDSGSGSSDGDDGSCKMTMAGHPRNHNKRKGSPQCSKPNGKHEVRCCNKNGQNKIRMKKYGCNKDKTFAEAKQICEGKGYRLCTAEEIKMCKTCGTGCGYDNHRVWTSTGGGGPTTSNDDSGGGSSSGDDSSDAGSRGDGSGDDSSGDGSDAADGDDDKGKKAPSPRSLMSRRGGGGRLAGGSKAAAKKAAKAAKALRKANKKSKKKKKKKKGAPGFGEPGGLQIFRGQGTLLPAQQSPYQREQSAEAAAEMANLANGANVDRGGVAPPQGPQGGAQQEDADEEAAAGGDPMVRGARDGEFRTQESVLAGNDAALDDDGSGRGGALGGGISREDKVNSAVGDNGNPAFPRSESSLVPTRGYEGQGGDARQQWADFSLRGDGDVTRP